MPSVVITGASSGIGKATAIAFARRGWSVVVAARGREGLEAAANEIEIAGGRAFVVVCDVAREDDVDRLARDAAAAFGRIDVWINNASVAEWSFIENMPPEEMRRVIEVDLLGTMYGCRAILPHFREHGGGTIINVASALADRAIPLLSTYCAAKAGVKAFSDALRMELRARNANVSVVTVKPSSIDTPFYTHGRSRLGVRPHPVSRIYAPEKVAKAIVGAAERPRRDVYVGLMGKLLAIGERFSPRLMDWYMLQRNEMFRQQISDIPDHDESNLYSSPGETRIRGDFADEER
jgi:NAD(P)-dependent dehydrogenase (short-subunit alcohol dehydrogenase family)